MRPSTELRRSRIAHPVVTIFYDCIKDKTPLCASRLPPHFRSQLTMFSLHSFVTPVPPVNPLDFVPDFDPLVDKLSRTFGRPTGPIPPGSAVLAPGQRKPIQPYVSLRAQFATSPSTRLDWKDLLAQAADAFIGAGGCASTTDWKDVDVNKPGLDDASVFTAEAYRMISQVTRRKRKSSNTAPPASDADSDSAGNDTLGSIVVDGVKQEGSGANGDAAKGKKAKRRRSRKRVGH